MEPGAIFRVSLLLVLALLRGFTTGFSGFLSSTVDFSLNIVIYSFIILNFTLLKLSGLLG